MTLPFLEWTAFVDESWPPMPTAEIALADYERTVLSALEEAERAITASMREERVPLRSPRSGGSVRARGGRSARQRYQLGV